MELTKIGNYVLEEIKNKKMRFLPNKEALMNMKMK